MNAGMFFLLVWVTLILMLGSRWRSTILSVGGRIDLDENKNETQTKNPRR